MLLLAYVFVLPIVPRYIGIDVYNAGVPFFSVIRLMTLFVIYIYGVWWLYLVSSNAFKINLHANPTIYKLTAFLLLYILALFVSVALSVNIKTSLKFFLSESVFISVILFYVFYLTLGSASLVNAIIKVWLVSTSIIILVALLELFIGASVFNYIDLPGKREIAEGFLQVKERAGFLRLQSTLDNPVTLSVYLLMTFPLLTYMYEYEKSFVRKIFFMMMFWLAAGVLVSTYVRSAWALFLVTIIVMFRKKYVYVFSAISLMFMIVIFTEAMGVKVFGFAGNVAHSVVLQGERQVKKSTVYRMDMVSAGFNALKKSPIFGIGPGNFGDVVKGEYYGEPISFKHHENFYITLLVESGIVGFLVFMLLIFYIMRTIWAAKKRETDRKQKALYSAILLSIVNYLAMSLFLDSFSYFQIGILFWLLIALAFALIGQRMKSGYYSVSPRYLLVPVVD